MHDIYRFMVYIIPRKRKEKKRKKERIDIRLLTRKIVKVRVLKTISVREFCSIRLTGFINEEKIN